MKRVGISALVFLGAGLLIVGLSAETLRGQTQNPLANSSTASRNTERSSHSKQELTCADLNCSAEQIAREARTLQEKLQTQLAELQKQIANEKFMNSEDIAKLQSLAEDFNTERGALESRAADLAARAQDLAAQAEDQATQAEKQMTVRIGGMPGVEDEEDSGWLGMEIGEVTAENAKDLKLSAVRGVVVQAVDPDGPAAKAELKAKDVITQYDGQVVEGTLQFRRLVRETPPGRSVTLTISRDGNSQTATVVVGDRSAQPETNVREMRELDNSYMLSGPDARVFAFGPEAMDPMTPKLGIEAEDLNGQLGAYFGAPGDSGILVREVREGSPAEKAGVKAGDVITQVDGKPVKTLAELRRELRSNADQKDVKLSVLRKGSTVNLSVAIEKPQPPASAGVVRRAQI